MYTHEFRNIVEKRENYLTYDEIYYIITTSPQLRVFPDIYSPSYVNIWCFIDEFGEQYSISEIPQ